MTSEARFFVKRKLHKKCGVFEACKKAIGFFDTLKQRMLERASVVFLIFKTFSSAAVAEDIGHGLLLLLLLLLLICESRGGLLADSHGDGEGLTLTVNAEGELIARRTVGYD